MIMGKALRSKTAVLRCFRSAAVCFVLFQTFVLLFSTVRPGVVDIHSALMLLVAGVFVYVLAEAAYVNCRKRPRFIADKDSAGHESFR